MGKTVTVEGAGEIRLGKWYAPSAELSARDGTTWSVKRSGVLMRHRFSDAAGGEPARYERRGSLKRGGELIVGDSTYSLEPSSRWKERYALVRGDQELATIAAGGWSGTRMEVAVSGEVEPIVVLAATWLVQQFASDSGSAAAAGAG